MKRIFGIGLVALMAFAAQACSSKEGGSPSIPSFKLSIADFGAVGDGEALNTEAFAKALARLQSRGGGHLTVPAGIWLTGPITLASNTDLHLEKGAVISFKPDFSLYPVTDTNFEGMDTRRNLSPLNVRDAHDVSITGEGVIDGNGQYWRELHRKKVAPEIWQRFTEANPGVIEDDVWYPTEGYILGRKASKTLNVPEYTLDEKEIEPFLRPVMISIVNCENVLLEGCTYRNSPCWNIHPLWCRNLTVRGITVQSPDYAVNGDGIDIDGCENVLLENCVFSVGDDAICLKSGKNEDGRRHARPCRDVTIRGCEVYNGHGGFVIGSEMSGGVYGVDVSDCSFIGTETGLRIKTAYGRGGEVSDIRMSDIRMKDIVRQAIVINMAYAGTAVAVLSGEADSTAVDCGNPEEIPHVRNLVYDGIVCPSCAQAILINGLKGMEPENIELRNCTIQGKVGACIVNASGVHMENCNIIQPF